MCLVITIRDLYQQLQRLRQGSKIVDEYHKEMEMLMIKTNIVEEEESNHGMFLEWP